jgi:NAD+ synthase (glutamine-hydrolysing)
MKRLQATGIEKVDRRLRWPRFHEAALVAVRARPAAPAAHERPRVTLPGFVTSRQTHASARLMERAGLSAGEIDIRPSAKLMLGELGHPYAKGRAVYDVTFENVQAGERTSKLFRLANFHDALVLGTGDLSELALGFTTYGVGDHMSHYNVNASVPKTLIRHLIRWSIRSRQFDQATLAVLERIAGTRISAELCRAATTRSSSIPPRP